jgi:hypothetical protein
MKTLVLLLLCSLQAAAQSVDVAKFRETESHAPKGYPTLFMVKWAVMQPGSLAQSQTCSMQLETLGSVYLVGAENGFTSPCKVYSPGTALWGHVHNLLGQVVDVIDPADPKSKSHRYLVTNVTLVDVATQ